MALEIVIVIGSPFHTVRKQSAAHKTCRGHVKESPLTMQSFCRKGWHKGHCRLQQNDNVVLASSPAQFTRKQNKNTNHPGIKGFYYRAIHKHPCGHDTVPAISPAASLPCGRGPQVKSTFKAFFAVKIPA